MVGAQLGYGLVWALVFSILSTCIVQEMASRLGLVTGKGLSENIVQNIENKGARGASIILICCAIGLGNAAYEGGNITGAALGLSTVLPGQLETWAVVLGACALVLLLSNRYHLLEKVLIALVVIMSLVFIIIMFIAGIELSLLKQGLGSLAGFSNTALLLAIIGTTIVPYNLFLHAGLSAKHANKSKSVSIKPNQLRRHRHQLFASIGIGGLITFAIMSSAVSAFYVTQTQLAPGNIANQLQPVLGDYANLFFAMGLFSAGLTSAITAPLATSYALCGLFNQTPDLSSTPFKLVSAAIVILGTSVALSGFKPLSIIILAQASNAILLPISVVFLLYMMNKAKIMGSHRNSFASNTLGGLVLITVVALGLYKLISL